MGTGELLVGAVVVALLVAGLALAAGRRGRGRGAAPPAPGVPAPAASAPARSPEGARRAAGPGDEDGAAPDRPAPRPPAPQVRPLDPAVRDAVADAWAATRDEFADDPAAAVRGGDLLAAEALRAAGHPVDEIERTPVANLSGPDADYRVAHDVAVAAAQGRATPDDLRRALAHHDALFARLLGDQRP